MKAFVRNREFDVTPTRKVRVIGDLLYGTFDAYLFTYDDANVENNRPVRDGWTSVLTGISGVPEILSVKTNTIQEGES